MLTLIRRLIYSKVGAVVAIVFLGLLAVGMVSGDVSSISGAGRASTGTGGAAVRVGDVKITPEELTQRVQQAFAAARQQQPTLTLPDFIAQGGFDATVERLTDTLALAQFGRDRGMLVSKRAVDGQIASIPGLQAPNGEFDPNAFRQLLSQQKLTERSVRDDFERTTLVNALIGPFERLQAPVALQLALPYANASLQRRQGVIAFVPTRAMADGAAPTDAEVQAFYRRNLARYTVPERRSLRYARVTPDMMRARATPSEADIAAAYRADAAKYAPTQQRTITQVAVLSQAAANTLAAKVKAGTPLVAAATAAGLTTSTKAGLTKPLLAGQTSPAFADAVFAAADGGVVGPVRGGLGFLVARVEKVEQVAGKTLAQARDELVTTLTTRRIADAINTVQTEVDESLAENATFDEIVKDCGLATQTSAPLIASGIDPDKPAAPDATLAPLLTAAFQMQEGDEPQLIPTGQDGSFALVALGRIVPAAPRPLAQLREQVSRDFIADRARQAARRVAAQMLARVNGGATMQAAWAQAGVSSEGPKPLVASREDVDRAQGPTKAPLALMFAIAPGTTKLLEAPGGAGWAIIRLDKIQQGDASRDTARVGAIRQAFGQLIGREYAEQFARAARAAVGYSVDPAVIARTKAALLGETAQ